MKRIFGWTSTKSFLSLGLLLMASAWSAVTWNRLQRADPQAAPRPDTVRPASPGATIQPDAAAKARLHEAYGQLPLSFEANMGQIDPQIDFISRGGGYTLFLSGSEAVVALRAASASPATSPITGERNDHESAATAVLRMKFVGSEAKPEVVGHEELPGKVNYLNGEDPKRWRTGISTYAKVAYEDLYPGVDLVYYGNQRQLEYDFVVTPGTDPNLIALSFEGADQLKVDAQGELVMHTGGHEIRQRKPLIYQEVDGVRHEVAGSYKLKDRNTVGFQLGNYDASRSLIIDPVLVYSTFLGSSTFDQGNDITVDASGNAYVVGQTIQLTSPNNFPTTPGAFDTTHNGMFYDAFVTKLNPAGSALVYSTFLGGSEDDVAAAIAVDSNGNAYVTGLTSSFDFPTTVGAFQTTYNGGRDAFVTKLNPSGSALVYSTFLGGFESDGGDGIALDTSGNAYIGGNTLSGNFPITPGAFDTVHNFEDVFETFVTKLNPTGSALIYSTFLGGTRGATHGGMALDAAGNVYVVGGTASSDYPTTPGAFSTTLNGRGDVFITKLNSTGTALIYSTFLGGSSNLDSGNSIALDSSGNAYVTGTTPSSDFPTTVGAFDTTYNGNFDVFVTKLNPTGTALVYSTFLGGGEFENGADIAVDTSGNAYLTGLTQSADFPTTVDAFDTTYNGFPPNGAPDVFVTKLNPTGSAPLVYSTFLGANLEDQATAIALDTFGSIYITGLTRSTSFPTTVGAFDTTHNGSEGGDADAFVTKLGTIVSSNFDVCLQDDGNGDSFQFDSTTGEYRFTQSAGGLTLTGRGTLSQRGCLLVLEDNQFGRRIKAQFNQCNNKGQAVIQIESERKRTFVITDKDTFNNNCPP